MANEKRTAVRFSPPRGSGDLDRLRLADAGAANTFTLQGYRLP
jgi:hypothetical protein